MMKTSILRSGESISMTRQQSYPPSPFSAASWTENGSKITVENFASVVAFWAIVVIAETIEISEAFKTKLAKIA